MTPLEMRRYIRGAQQREQTAAYTLSALVRVAVWSKRMPKPEEVFPREEQKHMDDEAMFRTVQALNALFGGTEE